MPNRGEMHAKYPMSISGEGLNDADTRVERSGSWPKRRSDDDRRVTAGLRRLSSHAEAEMTLGRAPSCLNG